jgi:hypothetical protein
VVLVQLLGQLGQAGTAAGRRQLRADADRQGKPGAAFDELGGAVLVGAYAAVSDELAQ